MLGSWWGVVCNRRFMAAIPTTQLECHIRQPETETRQPRPPYMSDICHKSFTNRLSSQNYAIGKRIVLFH